MDIVPFNNKHPLSLKRRIIDLILYISVDSLKECNLLAGIVADMCSISYLSLARTNITPTPKWCNYVTGTDGWTSGWKPLWIIVVKWIFEGDDSISRNLWG